jgi:tryptophan halogenase
MNVCILGHGNAGLMSALILKKNRPSVNISCIGSPEIGIVGVGESSTEHFFYLRQLLELEDDEIIKRCYATYKYGVYFEGWRDEDYVHALLSSTRSNSGVPISLYGYMSENAPALDIIPPHMIEPECTIDDDSYPNQYHFDTFKLNEMLRDLCEKHGVHLVNDTIDDVVFSDDGNVEMLYSSASDTGYSADLFIDASGFKRILVGKMSEFKFNSRQDDLFVDSAFAFQCEHEGDNYRQFTTAKRMSSGWMWRIPTYTRMGNGYAYSSKHITEEEALKEVTETLGFEPKIGRSFKFEAGHYETTWEKNVVAIGLSSHFFEPIEATAIGIGIMQSKLLVDYLGSCDPIATKSYNDKIQNMFSQAFKFIRLHYVNNNEDSEFWRDVAKKTIPPEVKKLIDIAQHRVITSGDVESSEDWQLFGPENFNNVLYGQGLIKPEILRQHLSLIGEDVTWKLRQDSLRRKLKKRSENFKTHKQHIESIINEDSTN